MNGFLSQTEALLAKLIAFPTVSSQSNLDMITYMAGHLESLGARVDVFHDITARKANLFATLGPERPGGILLSGHSDVVPVQDQTWKTDPFELAIRDDKLFGRGTCDMKGFIAATLAMAAPMSEASLKRPVHFCFTHDEEVGCLGAQALVPELTKRGHQPSIAIVGEPTNMRLVEGHKGCCEYTTRFKGLEGHGSDPDAGVNAVSYAVKYVTRLLELAAELKTRTPDSSRFVPAWTTVNIGKLQGGVAHNVIPGKAEVEWEMRPVQQSDADYVSREIDRYVECDLLPTMRAICPAADISTEVIGEVVGLTPVDNNTAVALLAGLTGQNTADVVPFGTEAGLFQEMGMSVVVCGPGSISQAHKPDEFVTKDQLTQCLSMLEGLARGVTA